MKLAIHTPGPWRASVGAGHVAIMTGPTIDTVIAYGVTSTPEGVANARLMAAAPEMLEALEVFVAAGADLQAGKRDGATMGRVSLATDAARALLARIRTEATP